MLNNPNHPNHQNNQNNLFRSDDWDLIKKRNIKNNILTYIMQELSVYEKYIGEKSIQAKKEDFLYHLEQ